MISFKNAANNPWGPPHTLNTFEDVKRVYDEIIANKQINLIPTIIGHHTERPDIIKLEPLAQLILEAQNVPVAISFVDKVQFLKINFNCSDLEQLIVNKGEAVDLRDYLNKVDHVYNPDLVCQETLSNLEQGNFNNFYSVNNALSSLNKVMPNEAKKPILDFIIKNIRRIGEHLYSLFTTLPWLDPMFIYGEFLKRGVDANDSLSLINLWIENHQRLPLEPLLKFMQGISDHYSIYKLIGEIAERNIPKPTALLQREYGDDIGVLYQMFDNEYPDFNVQHFQILLQQHEEIEQLQKIWKDPRFDVNLFQKFLVEKNLSHLAVQFIKANKENPNINIPLMQTLIESSNDTALMQNFVELDLKFNFKL